MSQNFTPEADHLREAVLASEVKPVIPSESNRRAPIAYDKALYKERNLVEPFFNKLKKFRRVIAAAGAQRYGDGHAGSLLPGHPPGRRAAPGPRPSWRLRGAGLRLAPYDDTLLAGMLCFGRPPPLDAVFGARSKSTGLERGPDTHRAARHPF